MQAVLPVVKKREMKANDLKKKRGRKISEETRESGPSRFSPVRMIMMKTANMSGYSARIPGASIVMYRLQNSSMCLPISSSKVALHALATLEVPVQRQVFKLQPTHYLPYLKCLTDDVREDEVPARDKGAEFSDCHVAIEVSRASFGDTGSELGVAQTSQDRGEGSDEEGEDDGRSSAVSGYSSSQHVHSGAQCAADAQGHQVQRVKAPREVGLLCVTVYNLHPQELPPNTL